MAELEVLTLIKDFGYPVVTAVALGWYMIKKDTYHALERAEWRKLADKQQDELLAVVANNNKALTDISITVNGLNAVVTGFLQKSLELSK